VAAAKAGLSDPRPDAERLLTLAPGMARPWMMVVVQEHGRATAYVKGAPEQVAARSDWPCVGPERGLRDRADWLEANATMAGSALRVFGVARKALPVGWREDALEGGWEWLGLVGMADPPRPGVRQALHEAHRAGIRTLMLTGDHPTTALAIARELDIAGDRGPIVVTAAAHPAIGADVYARVTPEGKYDLVRQLQAGGEVVGMTGDGVNDAPALRAAEAGIAMGQGTDVAKSAAAAVLLDQRLATVLEGVREGRAVFLNIQRAVDYLLTCSFSAMLVVILAMAASAPQPLMPLQLLYLNLLMHSFPALGLATEPADRQAMERPPLPRNAALLPPGRLASILWQAVLLAVATLSVGYWALAHGGEAHGRTLIFSALATALLCHTLSDRSPRVFGGWRARNGLLFVFLGLAALMQLIAIYVPGLRGALGLTPLVAHDWVAIAGVAIVTVLAIELSKPAFRSEGAP
jgi:Ca2+-transporting ATPase